MRYQRRVRREQTSLQSYHLYDRRRRGRQPHSHFDAVNQIDPYEFALREINNETNIKVEIANNKVNIIGDINKVTSIELFEADEENISANTTYYSTSLDVAKENELILDDNTTYYYVSIHDAKNVVISSKVFKK